MYNKLLLTTLFLIAFCGLSAQQVTHSCGFDHWRAGVHQQNPEQLEAMDQQYAHWLEQAREHAAHRDGEVYQIPVVFHIVHNTPSHNLADSVVHSQMEVLNEDYRRLNANASETRDVFLPVAGDVGIEFVLADQDPDGNPTNGIVRVATERESFELDFFSGEMTLDEVKFSSTGGSDAWDTDRYLNIWVCNIAPGFGQVFGMAYPPAGLDHWPDDSSEPSAGAAGVILHYTTLGRNNPSHADDGVAENNLGRTLVHEVGHYLGLRHIWGDAISFFGEDGCEVDDGIADTPNSAESANFVCNFDANTCTEEVGEDFPDMLENYMDYSQDACMNLFTQEQADMMRYVLTELRPGLLGGSVGINESRTSTVKLFPNPANDQITIEGTATIDRLAVYHYTGQQLIEQHNLNDIRVVLPVNHLAPGAYLVQIQSGGITEVQKLIIK